VVGSLAGGLQGAARGRVPSVVPARTANITRSQVSFMVSPRRRCLRVDTHVERGSGTVVDPHGTVGLTRGCVRGPGVGLLAWERATADDRALVVLDGHPLDRAAATLEVGFAPGTVLTDALGAAGDVVVTAAGTVAVDIGPREAAIYVAD